MCILMCEWQQKKKKKKKKKKQQKTKRILWIRITMKNILQKWVFDCFAIFSMRIYEVGTFKSYQINMLM